MTDRTKQAALREKIKAITTKLRRGGPLTEADKAVMMEAAAFADNMPEHANKISAVALAKGVLKDY